MSAVATGALQTFLNFRHFSKICLRFSSTRRSELFDLEKKRQNEEVGRIEKIEVECIHPEQTTVVMMNKNLSTPYDCTRHFTEKVSKRTAVALINGETLWHMHKPLPDSCKLEFLNYEGKLLHQVNKVFWRTCSFLLGAVAERSFKENVDVQLHSFPIPNVKTGSFVYDVQLSLQNWKPTEKELRVLSLDMIKFCQNAYPIECLDVGAELALLVFEDNPNKTRQIPDIAANNGGKITLFKAGPHVDISKGPMIANTNQLGRMTVANVIKLDTDIVGGPVYRFQGVALPSNVILSHFAHGVLEQRAKSLNPARIPGTQGTVTEDNTFMAQMTSS